MVPEINVPLLETALRRAGNDQVTVKVFPNANHGLLLCRTGGRNELPLLRQYAPGFIETLLGWLQTVALPDPQPDLVDRARAVGEQRGRADPPDTTRPEVAGVRSLSITIPSIPTGPIYVISGVPGLGKTTVAHALCERFPRAVHLHGDDLRALVVSGGVSGLDPWTAEHQRQWELSWRCEALMASAYSDAGFAVVIDDVLREEDLVRVLRPYLHARPLPRVLLKPPLDIAMERNRTRTNKAFDPVQLDPVIRRLYDTVTEGSAAWMVVDPTSLTVAATVDAILRDASPRSV